MPAYNFQKQFVPKILDGSKPHTIRRRRKHPTKVGDVLYLYTGLRTKSAFKFAEAVCTKIEPVLIRPLSKDLMVAVGEENKLVSLKEEGLYALARRDGFTDIDSFFNFFWKTYQKEYLADFEIIWWNPKELKSCLTMLKPEGDIKGKSASLVIFDEVEEISG